MSEVMSRESDVEPKSAPATRDGSSLDRVPQNASVTRIPAHVGIIMDGNGRWALARGLPRIEGHRRGLEALRQMVRSAITFKISYVTIYSFSSENWSRPADEVQGLMSLLRRFLRHDLARLHEAGVRVRVIGRRDDLAADIRRFLEEAENKTRLNHVLTLTVAFNYGGRQEITSAVRAIARAVASGLLKPDDIDEATVTRHLCTAEIPDPDLVIRTSGEQRLSNFLPWQTAYSELVFLPMAWPDFDDDAFAAALREFAGRERRYGGLPPLPAIRAAC